MTLRIAASLWSVPPAEQAGVAARLAQEGIGRLHWDVADGTLGPAGGFVVEDVARLSPRGATHEAHLMCADPLPMLDAWLPRCDAIAVHAGLATTHACLERIRAAGVQPVLAVADEEELLRSEVPADVGILAMAVRPGHAGSAFNEGATATVAAARARGHALVGVDGSVTAERGRALREAGATWLVSGASLTASDGRAWRAAVEAHGEDGSRTH